MNLWQRLFPPRIVDDSHQGIPLPTPVDLKDLRVILPEYFTAGTGEPGYLDFDLIPPELAEVQRTGLFMLTQLSSALESWRELQKLKAKYEIERTQHANTRDQLDSLGASYDELLVEKERFRSQWQEVVGVSLLGQQAITQLETEIAALRDAAAYDKEYIATLEQRWA